MPVAPAGGRQVPNGSARLTSVKNLAAFTAFFACSAVSV